MYFVQKFDNRAVVVTESEMKHWEKLSTNDMSEELDDAKDPNTLIVHKVPWRSQGMCYMVEYLLRSSTYHCDYIFYRTVQVLDNP